MTQTLIALAALVALVAAPARAAAPEPKQPVALTPLMGRWYEIVRTPNDQQRNCHGAYQTWSARTDGAFDIDLVCHAAGPSGRGRHVAAKARVTDATTNAKFEAAFFGGLLRRSYWIIDHGSTYDWMIASTADGRNVALLARTPGLPASEQARLTNRIRSLGFTGNALQSVGHDGVG